MTREQVKAIITERLGRWAERLLESHATPVVLVAVGHDARSGQLVVCACEDGPSDKQLALFLKAAAKRLKGKR